jgi:hypothetical protein
MNRAIVIPFHHYQPHGGVGYRALFEYWIKNLPLWKDEVDKIYIIDSDMDFKSEDLKMLRQIKPNTIVLKRELDGHHWVQYKWVLQFVEEENILFLDHDVVFNTPGVIDAWFQAIESGYDFVGSFDGSGGLVKQIHEKFPFMKEHNFSRMGSYYFILPKRIIDKIPDFDFAPMYFHEPTYIKELDYTADKGDFLDSFGYFTLKLLSLNPKIKIIEDPRETIYLQPSEDKWVINREPESPNLLGYYHIRNGNLANYVITSKITGHEDDYIREINGNKRELLRSLAWFYHMSDFDGDPLLQILKDMGIRYREFLTYYDEFEKYHGLIGGEL